MMHLSSMNLAWLAALALLASMASCGKGEHQRGNVMIPSDPSSGTQDIESLIFSCSHPDYGYMVFVNGEPVQCGTSPGFFATSSFPVRKGSNHISVTLSFLPKDRMPSKDKMYVYDW